MPASKRLKFMFLKKGCLLTSAAPSSWQPSLCFASLVSSCEKIETHGAMPGGPCLLLEQRACGEPVTTSLSQVRPRASQMSLLPPSPAWATQEPEGRGLTCSGLVSGWLLEPLRALWAHTHRMLRGPLPPAQRQCCLCLPRLHAQGLVPTGRPLMSAEFVVPVLIQVSCKGKATIGSPLIHLHNSQVQCWLEPPQCKPLWGGRGREGR